MHVLIISQYFWPENFIINHLAGGLVKRGHQVDVLTGMPNYPKGKFFDGYRAIRPLREKYEGVNVVRVPLIARGNSRVQLAANYLSFAVSAATLGPALLSNKYDVVFVYAPSPATIGLIGLEFKALWKIPFTYWVQDLWPDSLDAAGAPGKKIIRGVIGRVMRSIYRASDLILVPSSGFGDAVVGAGGARDRIRFLPNTVEDFYQPMELPADAPEREEISPNVFNVVYGGNLGEAQSLETLVQAADLLRDHRDIRWVLIGDGRRRAAIETDIARRKLDATIRFLGPRSSALMPRYFALADALVMTLRPDRAFARTIPSKLQAYLACGRPVIASVDGEAANVVVEAGAGFAVPAGDARALAEAVMRLRDSTPKQRDGMASAARAYFELHYARESVLDRLVAILTEAVQARQR